MEGFNISYGEIESNDVETLYKRFLPIINKIRKKKISHVEVVHTYRLGPHATTEYGRSQREINLWKTKDPLRILEKKLLKNQVDNINNNVSKKLDKIEKEARSKPMATLGDSKGTDEIRRIVK